jgi:hypothetical protein
MPIPAFSDPDTYPYPLDRTEPTAVEAFEKIYPTLEKHPRRKLLLPWAALRSLTSEPFRKRFPGMITLAEPGNPDRAVAPVTIKFGLGLEGKHDKTQFLVNIPLEDALAHVVLPLYYERLPMFETYFEAWKEAKAKAKVAFKAVAIKGGASESYWYQASATAPIQPNRDANEPLKITSRQLHGFAPTYAFDAPTDLRKCAVHKKLARIQFPHDPDLKAPANRTEAIAFLLAYPTFAPSRDLFDHAVAAVLLLQPATGETEQAFADLVAPCLWLYANTVYNPKTYHTFLVPLKRAIPGKGVVSYYGYLWNYDLGACVVRPGVKTSWRSSYENRFLDPLEPFCKGYPTQPLEGDWCSINQIASGATLFSTPSTTCPSDITSALTARIKELGAEWGDSKSLEDFKTSVEPLLGMP